jgi:hypothetical protein
MTTIPARQHTRMELTHGLNEKEAWTGWCSESDRQPIRPNRRVFIPIRVTLLDI